MKIKKYWLNDDIYIYVIHDNDQKAAFPTKADVYIGRKGYGNLNFVFGLFDDQNYPKNMRKFIFELHNDGYFNGFIDELMDQD